MDDSPATVHRPCDDTGHLLVGEALGAGELVAAVACLLGIELGDHAAPDVLGPDRLEGGVGVADQRERRKERQAAGERHPRILTVVDDRRGEDRRLKLRLGHRLLRERLRAEEPRPLKLGCADCGEEDEPLDARLLGRPQEPGGGEPVQLLHLCGRLIADRRGEVDHGFDTAKRLAPGARIAHLAEVAKHDPHVHTVAAEAARVAHERSDVVAPLDQERKERLAHGAGGSGHKNHAHEVT